MSRSCCSLRVQRLTNQIFAEGIGYADRFADATDRHISFGNSRRRLIKFKNEACVDDRYRLSGSISDF